MAYMVNFNISRYNHISLSLCFHWNRLTKSPSLCLIPFLNGICGYESLLYLVIAYIFEATRRIGYVASKNWIREAMCCLLYLRVLENYLWLLHRRLSQLQV
ncbi:uncharacterized protein [Malus domestica]|uniref:uncharacterized protein n=1 Tax=Malus domestica TaxID=3750 RepID=UPI0039754EF0